MLEESGFGDPRALIDCIQTKMPFGKFAGRTISDLPEEYLLWFEAKGFPKGQLGKLMAMTLEIKKSGCDGLLKKLKDYEC